MAIEKILNTRVINKHDSLTNWNSSSLKLKDGEIALAYVETTKPDGHGGSYTIPTYLMKVGIEGKTFSELEWLAAPASDVYAWAKLENPTIAQLPSNLKTAIENLQSAVGDGGSVAESIANAINLLDSETTGSGTIVKSVVQTDGKVSVEMGTLSADEIPTLTVSKLSDFETAVATKVESYGYETIANVNAYKEEVAEALDGKVAKDGDKVLTTNDLTNELKGQYDAAYTHSQVAHAPADAQANIIESVKVNGEALTIIDKAVDVTVPTKVSDLENDSAYLVAADIANKADKATTLAGYGIGDAYTKDEVDGEIEGAINTFVSAYITSDGGAIDKLQEIANWIDSDKNGAADIITDIEANADGIENLGERMDAAEDAIEAIDNHSHENKTVIDGITAEKVAAWDGAEAAAKGHADGLNTAMNVRVEALEAIDHEHANKALLDTYTQTETDLADAVSKKHSHSFVDSDVEDAIAKKHNHTFVESELNKIVDGDVAKWNEAEQNAKDYADSLASNYATAEQGGKADSALQEITTTENGGLKVTNKNQIDIDENIIFVFDCGDSGVNA